MGLLGPNPGGPGLTPYTGGAPGTTQPYPSYPTAPGAYGATQPYPTYPAAPSAAGTSDTEVVTNGPQGSPPPDWSARRNVIESEHYTRLLEHNRGFPRGPDARECGPITDPQLHQNCLGELRRILALGRAAPGLRVVDVAAALPEQFRPVSRQGCSRAAPHRRRPLRNLPVPVLAQAFFCHAALRGTGKLFRRFPPRG